MFWSIFLNSLALIIGILVAGFIIDKVVRGMFGSSAHKTDGS